jgi:hypothetical protein
VKPGAEKDQRKLGKKECMFCTSRKVETKKNFILEHESFKNNTDNYVNILTTSSWANLFSKGTVEKLRVLIISV